MGLVLGLVQAARRTLGLALCLVLSSLCRLSCSLAPSGATYMTGPSATLAWDKAWP